ncbi:TraB/GumN family protein [Shewanella violacea]|uniref:GumN family protein n=1 Tax=Shewanella violacea (strain JCM 10179 / CIP 106290 / LMG 19151 / DSS12) TaxID=637905 RepID=D4ZES5_SHEVD|nr:TraB/GumN family protein [Shewanella violacea]BAJ00305.1 conserved hypothetical protein [Shewanella violacea DSS12]
MATSRHRLLLCLVWFTFSGFIPSALAGVEDRPPFFQIDYQGKTAYLLGSIHVGQADFYPMAPLIESKFESAGSLVVEADAASADIVALIRKYGLNTLPIDLETKTELDAYCKPRASACAALSGFAPWLQSIQVGMNRFEELGYSASYGVDQRFITMNRDRPLLELESTEFQFNLLASFDEKSQWAMVREAIESPDEDMHGLITAWRTGDTAHIAELMEGQMLEEGDTLMLDKLLWRRNIDMAARIRYLMQEPDTQHPLFIIIGAGHLVGDKSIPMEMTQHGAKIASCWQQGCD